MIALEFPHVAVEEIAVAPGPEIDAIQVESLLVELCRSRALAFGGAEVVVDCEPPTLALAGADVPKLRRCAALMLDSAVAGPEVSEIVVSARAAGTEERPLLMVAVRTAASGRGSDADSPFRDPEELALARLLVERTGGTLLISHLAAAERRLTLGLEVQALHTTPVPLARPFGRPARVVVADDNPRVRRVARRLLERDGFEVVEAPGALALVAHLDPEESNGRPPEWVLVDEQWFSQATDGGAGLRSLIESVVPASRVVLLAPLGAEAEDPFPGYRRASKPLGRGVLQEALESDSGAPSRNVDADSPNSFNR